MGVEHQARRAAAHEVALIASAGVAANEERIDLAMELANARETSAVKGRWLALVHDPAVEAPADRVVVRRAPLDGF